MKLFKTFKNSKAFTLIELLVVIAVLGILAAAVLVAINPANKINSAKNATVRSDLSSFGSTASVFNTDTGSSTCTGGGSYPSNTGAAQTMVSPCAGTFPATTYTVKTGPASCAPNTAIPCTSIAFQGTALSDGVIDASTNAFWCWRSTTGLISQTTAALCTAP